ncbi:MAG: hypothetical protein EOP51_06040 [Sphingobacteriales bacterium]|nr:MAG: hypothetical protein EOP51_06040 [Sphingobacteriales bacterium]
MKRILVVLLIICLYHIQGNAQTIQGQDRQLLFHNLGFGVVSSGVGAIINKPKNQKLGICLRNSLLQGLAGGGLLYAAKRMDNLIYREQATGWAWPSHIIHAVGYSMIENAASGRPAFQSWNFSLGPVRFDYNLAMEHRFRARLLPSTVMGIYYARDLGGRFDWKTSLELGQMVYKHQGLINNYGALAQGVAFGRTIVYADLPSIKHDVLGHELIHTYQFNELQVINTYTNPLTKKVKNKILLSIFTDYIYADVPWIWFIYPYAGNFDNAHHYQNWFEFEAQHFSSYNIVDRK